MKKVRNGALHPLRQRVEREGKAEETPGCLTRWCGQRAGAMNLRLLVPSAGLAGGLLTGWLARPGAPSPDEPGRDSISVIARATPAGAGAAREPGILKLSELQNRWTEKEGDAAFYEALTGVPAAALLAQLNELMPPDTVRYGSFEYERREAIRRALVERLVEYDPGALAGWLMRVPPGHTNGGWLMTTSRALIERKHPDAKALLARLAQRHPYMATMPLEVQAETDPEGAVQAFLKEPLTFMPETAVRWLASDPVRAAAFCNKNPDYAARVLVFVSGQGLAALAKVEAGLTNPAVLRELRHQQLGAAAREGETDTFVRLITRDGSGKIEWKQNSDVGMLARFHPDKAEAVLRQFADQHGIAEPLLRHLAPSHPERTAALLATPEGAALAKESRGHQSAGVQVLQNWSLTDPAAALAWLRGLPAEQRAGIVPHTGNLLAEMPAEDWLAMTRGLPLRDVQARGMADQAYAHSSDPVVLADWSLSLPDKPREAIVQLLRQKLKDGAAAETFSQRVQAGLSAGQP